MQDKISFVLLLASSCLFLTSGIFIGIFGFRERPIQRDSPTKQDTKFDPIPLLIEEISATNIGSNLRHLTSVPHVAGTSQDLEQAVWIRDRFLEFGLDKAAVVPYQVLLSYPNANVPNRVYLLDEKGDAVFTTSGRQTPIFSPEEASRDVLFNFNAYSGSGTVEGDLVYGHYGREEDYQVLQSRGIDVHGKILLLRYGAGFRGSKVALAQKMGAIGVIMFSDPVDRAAQGRDFVYADSWWMPGMAVESGSLYIADGDPLTPLYPSIESAFRMDVSEAPLPKIPVQPIGYDEAEVFLRSLSSENPAPAEWQGKLNTTYHLGPGMTQPGWNVKLEVLTSNKMATIHNTIGILRGSEEDDRYVLIGNHRDAWTFGALDPSSGTASMMEVARAYGALRTQQNWRPRRSIVFCSWGGEEFGIIGSYEWVQQHNKLLSQRAVAYINVDVAVGGNQSFGGSGFPTLHQAMKDSAQLVPNPNPAEVAAGRSTVYDTWTFYTPDPQHPGHPKVEINPGLPGGGSDFQAFAYITGIPIADFSYSAPYGYPTYHTLYDTYHLATMIDNGFLHHQAVARVLAVFAANLADSQILPFDLEAYASFLNQSLDALEQRYGQQLQQNIGSAPLGYFRTAVDEFAASIRLFINNTLSAVDTSSPLATRKVNDRLIQLERFFTDPRGLPGRPETNHIVFSTSSRNSYAGNHFTGLTDLLEAVGNQTQGEQPEIWRQIRHHLSVIAFLIQEAGRWFEEDV